MVALAPDGRAFFHKGLPVFVLSLDKGPGIDHVGKNTGGTTEDVILDDYIVIDGNIVLNLDTIAENSLAPDIDVLPY
jgi:hypothetical protein